MTRLRVAYVGREVPLYRVALFQELARRFEFAAFAVRFRGSTAEQLDGAARELQGWFPLGLERYYGWLDDGAVFRDFRPDAVLHEFSLSLVSNHVLRAKAESSGARVVWWGHAIPRRALTGYRDTIRRWGLKRLACTGNAFVTYSPRGQAFLDGLLARSLPVVEAPNTVDSPGLRSALQEIDRGGGRAAMRELLGVRADPQLAILARLLPEKRIGATIEAALAAVGKTGLVHVIGDGPDRGAVKARLAAHVGSRLRWWGTVSDEAALMQILVSADALIAAGTLGLSAIHAMFAGLPVIACRSDASGPWHGPEVEYLDTAGGVWWSGASTPGALGELASKCLAQRELLLEAGRANRLFAERYLSLNGQVTGIARGVQLALGA